MTSGRTALGWALAAALTGAVPAVSAACTAETGSRRAVLVELYTSEGCDSCPPADAWLSRLKERGDLAGTIVPLAFHVDYWDRLGWTDRYASRVHTDRQGEMAARAGTRLVYTPQFLRNGADWRDRTSLLGPAAAASVARIGINLAFLDGTLAVSGEVVSANPAEHEVFVAAYENKLVSEVRAGENAGRRLQHDYVVRALAGPMPVSADGTLALQVRFPLGEEWKRPDLGVVVFVQERKRPLVVQSLQRHACGTEPAAADNPAYGTRPGSSMPRRQSGQ